MMDFKFEREQTDSICEWCKDGTKAEYLTGDTWLCWKCYKYDVIKDLCTLKKGDGNSLLDDIYAVRDML